MSSVNQNQAYNVPSFARQEAYDFDVTKDSFEIYQELNEIAKEIEECRLRNC
jgi:hypothetical protein